MKDAVFVLALMALAISLAIAFVLYRVRRPAAFQPTVGTPDDRTMQKTTNVAFFEPETRFIEVARKSSQYRLLNTSEQALFHRLVEAMPNMTVFAQVGIAQLVQLRGQHAVEEIWDIANRCINFVVCREDFTIVAALDLSWPTDDEPGRRRAAESKRQALEKLEIPLIVYRPHQLPSVDTIAKDIAQAVLRHQHSEARK